MNLGHKKSVQSETIGLHASISKIVQLFFRQIGQLAHPTGVLTAIPNVNDIDV